MAVAGSELHYERRGQGPPLLLIQGMGANGTHWGEPFLAELERDFELVLYDHRGIGRSAPLQGAGLTVAGLAADALALLDALGIAQAHVLGISMGGMVAQELALAAPDRVRTLILGATSCGGTQARATAPEVVQRLTTVALSRDRELMLRTGFELVVSRRHAADPAHFARSSPPPSSFRRRCRSCSPRRAPPTGTTPIRACARCACRRSSSTAPPTSCSRRSTATSWRR